MVNFESIDITLVGYSIIIIGGLIAMYLEERQ